MLAHSYGPPILNGSTLRESISSQRILARAKGLAVARLKFRDSTHLTKAYQHLWPYLALGALAIRKTTLDVKAAFEAS